MFIFYEFSWDKHNANYNRIYQLQLKTTYFGRKDFTSSMPRAIRYHVLDKVPEVEKAVLMHGSAGINENFGEFISSDRNNLIYEKAGFYAEQTIFDITGSNFKLVANGFNFIDKYEIHRFPTTLLVDQNGNLIDNFSESGDINIGQFLTK